MSDIWDSFYRGAEWGGREGGRIRDARAYRQGGLDSVADAAGRTGDLSTLTGVRQEQRTARRFEDEQTQQAYQRMEQVSRWAIPVLRRAQSLPPEQRGAWLNQPHLRQRFEDFGIAPEQIDAAIAGLSNPETADQWFTELNTAFTQHQNPEWRIMDSTTGQIGAIDHTTGQYIEGGTAPAGAGAEWRPARPEEMAGFQPGTAVDINIRTGERRARQNPHYGRSGAAADAPPSLPPNFQWED